MKNVFVLFLFKEIIFKVVKCLGLLMLESIRSFGVLMGFVVSMMLWCILMV